jgi:hypothetical protein
MQPGSVGKRLYRLPTQNHPQSFVQSNIPTYPGIPMNTLAEIETAADKLPLEQQKELFLFLGSRLRGIENNTWLPRDFSREQMHAWIVDDEEGMRRFLQSL